MGLKAITRRINEMGYRTKKNNLFNVLGVKNILTNPIYIGKIRFNQLEDWAEKRRKGKNTEYILADGTHEPIISLEQWENVQRIMKKRSYKPVRSHTPFILAGLLRCPKCGYGMVAGRSKGSSGQTYRYTTADSTTTKEKPLAVLTEFALTWLSNKFSISFPGSLQTISCLKNWWRRSIRTDFTRRNHFLKRKTSSKAKLQKRRKSSITSRRKS